MFGGGSPGGGSPGGGSPCLTAPALTEGDTRLVDKQCVSDEPSQRCGLLLCSRGSEKFGFKSEKIV